ncbi:hypothetical protein [Thermostaphylospora chromogena]|uniref:Uncharacterized protein n=1 Tax=Thermostaphylospora chromogena TaxID=35622 RepID=A0A1H1FDB9_9ACTN|nr:hypothetical protein [Thermostaphylospora chromogena]SDQ98699.1 hypothetical protein SAMN04489764_2916 [Thermostaphylospora chromogena]
MQPDPVRTAHRPVEALKPAELPRAPEPVDPVRAAYQRSHAAGHSPKPVTSGNTEQLASRSLPVESLRPGASPLGDPEPVDPIRAALERRG